MAVNTSSIVSTLGAGSGIDIKTLAESLVEAERKPFKDRIDAKIAKTEAKISGYGAISSYLQPLRESFLKLRYSSAYGSLNVSNSQASALTVTAGTGAVAGNHTVQVLALANSQRTRSAAFDGPTQSLNGGQTLTLQLAQGGAAARSITVASPTPQALVDAINDDASANSSGISAQLVRSNKNGVAQYTIELQGQSGADQAFTLAIDPADYPNPPAIQQVFLSEASDARVMINNRLVTSAANALTDADTKLTLSLSSVTSAPAKIGLVRDVQPAIDNIKSLVSSYNDFQQALKELGDSKSLVETLGGSLVGDPMLQSLRNQMRMSLQLVDKGNTTVQALSGLGITIGLDGRMAIKSDDDLEKKLKSNFDEAVGLLTASQGGPSKAGLVGDALKVIDNFLPKYGKGMIDKQIESSNRDVTRYKEQLTQLEDRMSKSLDRYMRQFSIMESMVGDSNSVRAGLKNSFDRSSN